MPAVACLDGQGPVTAFGVAGLAEVVVPGGWSTGLAVQPNGDVLLLGQGYINSADQSFLTQFDSSGIVNVSAFGTAGMVLSGCEAGGARRQRSLTDRSWSPDTPTLLGCRWSSVSAATAVPGVSGGNRGRRRSPPCLPFPGPTFRFRPTNTCWPGSIIKRREFACRGILTPDGSVDTAFGDSGMTGTVFQNDTKLEPPLFLETRLGRRHRGLGLLLLSRLELCGDSSTHDTTWPAACR